MKKCVSLILILFFLFLNLESFSQCCSPGNPVGGTGNLGSLNEKTLKVILAHRYSYSGKYMEGNKPYDPYFVETGNFNYTGILLAYAINKRITTELETGYFENKSQTYVDGVLPQKKSGNGINSITLTPKINILKKNAWEITTGLGIKYPVGAYNKEFNGVIAELDIQPSTGATDFINTLFISKEYLEKHLRFFLYNRVELKGTNPLQYKYGNLYATSFFVSYSASIRWDFIAQIRSEYREKDERPAQVKPYDVVKIPISGSQKIFLTPQINYNVTQKFSLFVLADIPVYQYYNQQQLANTFSVSVGLSKKFKSRNKIPTP
jgi:Putative MetA-pathway of phenol degradation